MMTNPDPWRPEQAAGWLAEAMETGNPLAALPAEMAPRDVAEGEAVAAALLEHLGIVACGVRLLYRPGRPDLAGPMIEGRMVPAGSAIPISTVRHASATVAVIGVLAEAIVDGDDAPPRLAALHAAIDVASTRFGIEQDDVAVLTADLARLGLVVAGRPKTLPVGRLSLSLATKGARRKSVDCDLAAAFAGAATAARRFGGLPAGALLVVAGLTPPVPALGLLSASCGPLGRVEASFI